MARKLEMNQVANGPDAAAAFRTSLRHALDTAEARGLPPLVRTAIIVSQLASLVAESGNEEFETLLDNVLVALEETARNEQAHLTYLSPLENFIPQSLN